jgi:hypothetical protein
MKRIFGIIGVIIALFVLITAGLSCGSNKVPALLGEETTLSVGQIANIKAEGLSLKFVKVTADSRCPTGVECIQAGDVTCEVYVNYKGAGSTISITQKGGTDLTWGTLGPYKVMFKVQPHPEADKKIAESDYRMLITILK